MDLFQTPLHAERWPDRNLPVEILDSILVHLELADIRRLRLTCRTVEEQVGRTHRFRGHCNQKEVNLHSHDLSLLSSRITHLGPARYLEHLTLNGILWVTEGLERTLRDRTAPADPTDPCGLGRDPLGNWFPRRRRPASPEEVEAAAEQLILYRQRSQENDEEEHAEKVLTSLEHLLRTIRAINPTKALERIKLSVKVLRGHDHPLPPHLGTTWRRARVVARQTATICLKACHRSGIQVRELDVFTDTESCSIQPDVFGNITSDLHTPMGKSLKGVSLSLTGKAWPIANVLDASAAVDPDDECLLAQREKPSRESRHRLLRHALAKNATDETTAMSRLPEDNCLATWLSQIEELQDLHLEFYSGECSLTSESPVRIECCGILHRIAESSRLTKLRQLALCGWHLDTHSIMAILSNSPSLKNVCFRDITLTNIGQRAWREIFDHLTSPGAALTYIELSNLFERGGESTGYVVCSRRSSERSNAFFQGSERYGTNAHTTDDWDTHRPSTRDLHTFRLSGRSAVQDGIHYWLNVRYIVGSVQNSLWREFGRRRYGTC